MRENLYMSKLGDEINNTAFVQTHEPCLFLRKTVKILRGLSLEGWTVLAGLRRCQKVGKT
jgi:hypothetical protein